MTTTLQLDAMDTLFFRDSRPMNAGESAWIESMFPPTGRTLQGAIRTAILDYIEESYESFQSNEQLVEEIGDAHSLGLLELTGPWFKQQDTIYFPAPLDLVKNQDDEYQLLTPSKTPIECDLGNVHLPAVEGSGYKAQESKYISNIGMQTLLEGTINNDISKQITKRVNDTPAETALADREPKVGLARNNQTRTNREGMLFAIAPIRPRQGVSLCINIENLPQGKFPTNPLLQRLGGEGKLSHIESIAPLTMPSACMNEIGNEVRFKMVLTTNALMPNQGWLPDGFQLTTTSDGTAQTWQGNISGICLEIITACIGKTVKQGGWDHQNHQSRPLQSFVPAGSVYYCKCSKEDKQKIHALHGCKIGNETEYGFGHILIGQW